MADRPTLAPHGNPWRLAVAAFVLVTSGPLASPPSLQTVRIIVGDGATAVILFADGALPSPKVGVLTDPPRIYLDFPGVAAATGGTHANGDLLVRGVRVAANQSRPLVTRVVIDLVKPAPHRIEADLSASGQLTIIVGVATAVALTPPPPSHGQDVTRSAPAPPTPSPAEPPKAAAPAPVPAVPAAAPAASGPPQAGEPASRAARSPELRRAAGPAAARAPARDIAEYVRRVSSLHVLERLERLRPLLVSLDALAALPEEPLKAAEEEFGSIRQALTTIVPPRTLAATHELLRDVCVLGAASASARITPAPPGDSTRAWNAAAAAAGAIMLLDRARAEVGLGPGHPEPAQAAVLYDERMIRVCLAGVTGWVGQPLAAAIDGADDLQLVAAVARRAGGQSAGPTPISGTVEEALAIPSDVFVDYTSAAAVKEHVLAAVRAGRHVVVGSSGLDEDAFREVDAMALAARVGVVAVGNFAITAALLQRFAVEAARHLPSWEIIDSAYAGKIDAPSGTARELAWRLSAVRKPETEVPVGRTVGSVAARGAEIDDSRVHSIRLPGYTIGVEIRFGLQDERLTLSYDGGPGATPYVAGTLLAIRRVHEFTGVVRGLDRLL
jgi:4-hydroxy-tetrahydrodipicolinate reductase